MAPPPPLRYRSVLSGIRPLSLDVPDTSGARESRESTGEAVASSSETSAARRSASMTGLITEGRESHERYLLARPFARAEITRLEGIVPGLLEQAREGNRRSYYDAMMVSFVTVHRHIEGDHRDRAHAAVQRFRDLSREYLQFFQDNTDISSEDKLRYLFAAMRVVRTMLGRVSDDEDFGERYANDLSDLRTLMTDMLRQLGSYYQNYLLEHPNDEQFTGIYREIQLRLAVLENRPSDARQAALELVSFYSAHPPGEADPERPETNAWQVTAARELLQDPEINELLGGLDMPSTAEDSAMLVNATTLELLQVIGFSLDSANEEEPEAIENRYAALGAIATTLILAVPGISVPEILNMLRDEEQAETLTQLIEGVSEENHAIEEILTSARGEQSLEALLNRARAAADHLQDWETGAGHDFMEQLFFHSNRVHRIHRVGELLQRAPELAEALGYDTAKLSSPDFLRNYAVDLIRRGSTAVEIIEAYGARHPEAGISALLSEINSTESAGESVNSMIEGLLESLEPMAEDQPDHGVAVLHALFHTLAQTETLQPGVALSDEARARAHRLSDHYESFGFRAFRVLSHLTSGESLAMMAIGIVGPAFVEAGMISRAGAAGRSTLPLVGEVVNAGRLSTRGAALLGLGTGVAMAAVGAFLHNRRRERAGFTSHFWRDFGHGAVINGLTFGLTIPFSRWRASSLGRAAEEGHAIGSMSRGMAARLSAETALFGGTLAYGLSYGYRGASTGNWSWSWDEVAENYLSVLAWEMGSAAFRRVRSTGVGAELRDRPMMEAIPLEVPEGAGRLRRGHAAVIHGVRRGIAGIGNLLFTNLGAHRVARVHEAADLAVQQAPDVLGPHREFIERQLALEELASPGSIARYNDRFFARFMPYMSGEAGNPRLVFLPRPDLILEGYFGRPRTPTPEADAETPPESPRSEPEAPAAERTETPEAEPPAAATGGSRPRVFGGAWNESVVNRILGLENLHATLQEMGRNLAGLPEARRGNRSSVTLSYDPASGTLDLATAGPITRLDTRREILELECTYNPDNRTLTLPRIGGRGGTPVAIRFNGSDPVVRIGERRVRVRPPEGPPPDGTSTPPEGAPPSDSTPPEGAPPSGSSSDSAPPEGAPAARSASPPGDDEITGPFRRIDSSESPSSEAPDSPLILSLGSELSAITRPHPEGLRRGRHVALIPGLGEIGAFTHEGISKHSPIRNEDGYGIALGEDGLLIMMADGMGGEGHAGMIPGERASGTAVRTVLDMYSGAGFDLGRAFQAAHEAVVSEGHGGATVATALQIRPDGSARIAYAGDTRCFIARRGPDGAYVIFEAYLPYSFVGGIRSAHGTRPGFDTLTMHASPHASRVASGLGGRHGTPPVVDFWDGNTPHQIILQDLSILTPGPAREWVRNPYRLQAGDLAILSTDGVAELFNREQLAATLGARTRIEEILGSLETETFARLDLYRSIHERFSSSAAQYRSQIETGSFAGRFIDISGDIFDTPAGGNLVGHVGPDNVGLAVFRFDPGVTAE